VRVLFSYVKRSEKRWQNSSINFPSRAYIPFESGLDVLVRANRFVIAAVASSVNTDTFERVPASEWLIGGFLIEVVTAAMMGGVFPFG
jgi:hypothetical protein